MVLIRIYSDIYTFLPIVKLLRKEIAGKGVD
jgi:hypothetical protein